MKNIFVFCLPAILLAACASSVPPAQIINNDAAVPAAFGLAKLKLINSTINTHNHTTSMLYGNAPALAAAQAGNGTPAAGQYTLVTWHQKADENWFGANIPGKLLCIEKLTIGNQPGTTPKYQRYEGNALSLKTDTSGAAARIAYICAQKASVMP